MKVEISEIRVADRIRKQPAKIEELAADIEQNGLINPITVMPVAGEYQLLAGLRRLRATQLLGWTEIDANEVSPKDAEAALRIEYSENEQREGFTYSERMDYARLIEEIEREKARERQKEGGAAFGRGRAKKVMDSSPQPMDGAPQGGTSRDLISAKIGMSGRQYDRARYVADHAPQEVIDQLDRGERTIGSAYKEVCEKLKPQAKAAPLPKADPAPISIPPLDPNLARAIRAESELDAMKYRQHNEIYHRDSIIGNLKLRNDNLQKRVAELEAALEAANARVRELEEKPE